MSNKFSSSATRQQIYACALYTLLKLLSALFLKVKGYAVCLSCTMKICGHVRIYTIAIFLMLFNKEVQHFEELIANVI